VNDLNVSVVYGKSFSLIVLWH